jgi:hypothetical protein
MRAVCGSACNEVPTRDSPIRNASSNFPWASTGDALNSIDERYQIASHLGNVSGVESRSWALGYGSYRAGLMTFGWRNGSRY